MFGGYQQSAGQHEGAPQGRPICVIIHSDEGRSVGSSIGLPKKKAYVSWCRDILSGKFPQALIELLSLVHVCARSDRSWLVRSPVVSRHRKVKRESPLVALAAVILEAMPMLEVLKAAFIWGLRAAIKQPEVPQWPLLAVRRCPCVVTVRSIRAKLVTTETRHLATAALRTAAR